MRLALWLRATPATVATVEVGGANDGKRRMRPSYEIQRRRSRRASLTVNEARPIAARKGGGGDRSLGGSNDRGKRCGGGAKDDKCLYRNEAFLNVAVANDSTLSNTCGCQD